MNTLEDVRRHVLEVVLQHPSPSRSSRTRLTTTRMVAALAVAFSLFAVRGGVHEGLRPTPFIVGTSLGLVALAVATTWVGVGRGASSLGRPRRSLITVTLATPLTLLAWIAVWNVRYPETLTASPEPIRLRCFGFTLLLGALPLAVWVASRRRTDPVHPYATGASVGTAAGAWMAILVELWCPNATPAHIALGHAAPIAMLAIIGLALGRAIRLPGPTRAEQAQTLACAPTPTPIAPRSSR